MQRQWRSQGSGHGAARQADTLSPGKSTLVEAISFGAGEGEIQAFTEQRSKAGAPPGDAAAAPADAPGPDKLRSASAKGPGDVAKGADALAPGKHADEAPAAPAGAGQGAPAPPPPPTITHSTKNHAPSGAADTRTTVAVGEQITFDSTAVGDWSANLVKTGKPAAAHGKQYLWFAPSTAGTAKITFNPGGGAAKIDTTITIIEPAVDYLNATAVAFPGQAPGKSGVAMQTDVYYTPNTVSFANTMWWEQPGPASSATGYFVGKALPYHHPNPSDLQIDAHNTGINDTAGFWGFPAPYSNGFFEWVIPTHYKVTGDAGRHLITNVHQTCTMAPDGSMTVTKGGSASINRAP